MAITTTDKKLRVLRTNNFKNKAASERQQFDNDAIIFDASGGIYIGDGVNKEPILVAGAISTKDANTGVIDDPTVKGSRKVKDLIDNQTQEPIYIKGHAQATFMSDGRTVEEAVDTSNFATKTELAQKQDVISDIDTIRTNAANYKGTVTSVKVNGVTKNQSGGVVDLGYLNKQLSTTTSSSMTLSPNVYYRNTSTSLSTLTITLGGTTNNDIINEYFVEFTIRDAGTTVSLPNSIKWANGVAPTFENGKTYQISIVNNLGTCVKFG